jgi:hypothetical protein
LPPEFSESKNSGFWATGAKGAMQTILFLLVLGTVLVLQLKSAILLIGIANLAYYVHHAKLLTRKEILLAIMLGLIFGIISNMLTCLFALLRM